VESTRVVELPRTELPSAAVPVTCCACGDKFVAAPEATSLQPRGDYAIVAEWRICACGAFVRSERITRMDASFVRA